MEMTKNEFIDLVAEMRQHQKLFFKSKSREAKSQHLAKSKLLEKKVDNWITNFKFFNQ